MSKNISERDATIILANKVLDRHWGDPDDDLAMLSRQFLRALEEIGRLHSDIVVLKEMSKFKEITVGAVSDGPSLG